VVLVGSVAADPVQRRVPSGVEVTDLRLPLFGRRKRSPAPRSTDKVRFRRIERVEDRLFEGEESVLHLMGDQIRETKRRSSGLGLGGDRDFPAESTYPMRQSPAEHVLAGPSSEHRSQSSTSHRPTCGAWTNLGCDHFSLRE
jgi:hypothetical protein